MFFSIIVGNFVYFVIKNILGRNASTWPGHIAIESNPNFIKQVLNKNPNLKVVLIAGTNGKTTTTKALHHILEEENIPALRNDAGANLLNGLASLIVKNSSISGKIHKKALLFEVDENSLPLVLKQTNPNALILLNLFRDQLDRYGEINTTAEKWSDAIKKLPDAVKLIANADDPQIVKIANSFNGNKFFFSINDKFKNEKELSHAVDSTTCPTCRNELKYLKISYSHLGNFKCPKCGFTNPESQKVDIKTKLKGTFNIYNLTASIITADKVFNIKNNKMSKSLENFNPAFGRQEELSYRNKKIIILLSKNPTGLNESLKIVLRHKYINLLFVLNDRIPDGRDVSWIWDVDFEMLSARKLNIFVSGDRTYDLANRLKYAEIKNININDNLASSINTAVDDLKNNEKLVILPTYSAMLEARKILTGKSIL